MTAELRCPAKLWLLGNASTIDISDPRPVPNVHVRYDWVW